MTSVNDYSLSQLIDETNNVVIGQPEVVEAVAVCIYKFCIRTLFNNKFGDFINTNSNLLISGPTGTGKTFTVKTVCKLLDVPFIEINGKSICQEGWSGKSFLDQVREGMRSLTGIPNQVIVFIDEFDKIIQPISSSTNENYSEAIQHTLLKYVEGMVVTLRDIGATDTKNFCFIFGGAFIGMNDVKVKGRIGFNSYEHEEAKHQAQVSLSDKLIKYGMIPELAGRITSFAETKTFTKEMYLNLLFSDYFPFNRWREGLSYLNLKNLMELEGDNLEEHLAQRAFDKKLGARGLFQECDKLISDTLLLNKEDIVLSRINDELNPPELEVDLSLEMKPISDEHL